MYQEKEKTSAKSRAKRHSRLSREQKERKMKKEKKTRVLGVPVSSVSRYPECPEIFILPSSRCAGHSGRAAFFDTMESPVHAGVGALGTGEVQDDREMVFTLPSCGSCREQCPSRKLH